MRASTRARSLRVAVTAVLVIASGLAGLAAAEPARAAGCSLRYTVNLMMPVDELGNPTFVRVGDKYVPTGEVAVATHFVATFQLTNEGAAVNPWRASWSTQPNLRLVGNRIWNAELTYTRQITDATLVYLTAAEWNGPLPTGSTVSFGAEGIVDGGEVTVAQLVNIMALNGRYCSIVVPGQVPS